MINALVDRVADEIFGLAVVGGAVDADSDMQPSPTTETDRPLVPSERCATVFMCQIQRAAERAGVAVLSAAMMAHSARQMRHVL